MEKETTINLDNIINRETIFFNAIHNAMKSKNYMSSNKQNSSEKRDIKAVIERQKKEFIDERH